MSLIIAQAWGSALLAGVLSFASPKESSQRKGDPWLCARLRRVPCATRNAGRLAKLACGSDNASRLPPALLRCSARHKGPNKRPALHDHPFNKLLRSTAKTSRNQQTGFNPNNIQGPKSKTELGSKRHSRARGSPAPHMDSRLRGNDGSGRPVRSVYDGAAHPAKIIYECTGRPARIVFPGPLRGAEQRRRTGGLRLALSEPQASLASRPVCRVAQGTGQRPAPNQGWPFLWLLSFGHTKESTPASKAEPQAKQSLKANSAGIRKC